MRSFSKLNFVMLLIIAPLCLFGNSNFQISPQYSYLIYDSQMHYSDSHVYGIKLQYKISNKFSLSTGFSTAETKQNFEVFAGKPFLKINSNLYRVDISYATYTFEDLLSINLSGGVGAITLSSNRYKVDLGALGYRYIKAKSSTHFLYTFGIPIVANISSTIKVFLNPELLLFKTDSSINKNYNLAGGLTFDLF